MNEPIYVRQSAEPDYNSWVREAAHAAIERGATWFRLSTHGTLPHLRLIEAWRTRPQNCGAPRWALEEAA